MKSIFGGYFKPTETEFLELWEKGIFAVDANVLLNLYRYSPATKQELEKALNSVKDRVFIPHQAAKEFLKNRLNVTASQAGEYTKTIKTINEISDKLSTKDRHPFIPESELPKLKDYLNRLISLLENQYKALISKLIDDETLEFVEKLFDGKTGDAFDEAKAKSIAAKGDKRYETQIPPGYKDSQKDITNDTYRIYGDLFVWFQLIEYSKQKSDPLIFITDDKKEDWWLEQSGKTIGPRPELIEEFKKESGQRFWMYSVEKFIKESAKISDSYVSDDIINEIKKFSQDAKNKRNSDSNTIKTSQKLTISSDYYQEGIIVITLTGPMHYATGTGKFWPQFSSIPEFDIEFLSSPYEDNSKVGLSFGCGTGRDFNIHIKGLIGLLKAGEYEFKYKASVEEDDDNNEDKLIDIHDYRM